MISNFSHLAQKVKELADLAHFLRRENAVLRAETVTLTEQNAELRQRMQQAHERVAALLARIPGAEAQVHIESKVESTFDSESTSSSNVVA
ncbi:MAG: cell division protein ZapB [Pseudomonadota bacterium]